MTLTDLTGNLIAGIGGGLIVAAVIAFINWLKTVNAETLSILVSLREQGEYLFESGRGYSDNNVDRWRAESEALLKRVEETISAGISKKEAARFMEPPKGGALVNYYGGDGRVRGEHNKHLNIFRGYLGKLDVLLRRYS